MVCTQATTFIYLKQPAPSSKKEVIKVAPPTSILEVVKELILTSSTIMTPAPSLLTNVVSSSTSTPLEVHSPPKINYFVNLPSDSNELDDEFDPYTIFYPSNFIVNES
jgi:hypothetical protein